MLEKNAPPIITGARLPAINASKSRSRAAARKPREPSLAEERGFLGAAILLLLYLLVVWRGLKLIAIARDPFSAIAAGGIVFAFLFQVFVNVGMNIGVAPVTGIPLPFVSVGGSALIANLLAIGVLLAIHVRGAARPKAYR